MNITENLNSLITYVLWGDFGILTTVPYFLLRILFPIVTAFYLLQLFFIRSNLLKLFARKSDRFLNRLGLSSDTLLPLLLGFGCVTVALGALQIVENKRERRIAQALSCIMIPCSAQLVINSALIFHTAKHYFFAYIVVIACLFVLCGILLNTIFSPSFANSNTTPAKKRVYFSMPHPLKLLRDAFSNSLRFLFETALPFAVGNLAVSVFCFYGFFQRLCTAASPLIRDFLHLPPEAATLFVLSTVKKDLAASGILSLYQNGNFSEAQIFVTTVMLTLFVPCLASMIVLFKHEKKQICLLIWFFCVFFSLVIGKILSFLLILPTAV